MPRMSRPANPSEHLDDPTLSTAAGASMRRLWVLMATVFVDMMGAMIVLPLLPFYVLEMKAKPSIVGALVSTFFIAQIICSPLWGKLSDRYGRRPMILAGLLLSAASFLLFGLAHAVLLLFVSRLVQGAGSGTVGVVQAYVGDSIPAGKRAEALGWVSAATSAGVVIGPGIGSVAAHFGNAMPGYVAAALCLLNFAFAWRWLPESKRQGAPEAGPPVAKARVWRRLWEVVREPASPVGSLIWIYAIGMMAFMAMNAVLGLYLGQVYSATKENIGLFYSFIGAISLVMRALLLGPVVRRLGEVAAMRLGTLALTVGLAAMPLVALLPLPHAALVACFGAVAVLMPVGTALLFPSTTALVSGRSPREEMGQIMGVQQLFGGIARFLGPIWSTWLFGVYIMLPFWAAAFFMLCGGLLTLRIRHPGSDHGAAASSAPAAPSSTSLAVPGDLAAAAAPLGCDVAVAAESEAVAHG
jgi:multidrug resistance protein